MFEKTNDKVLWAFTRYIETTAIRAKQDYLRHITRFRIETPMSILPETGVYDRNPFMETLEFEESTLSKTLSQMSGLRKKILALWFMEGLTAKEIAGQLKCSVRFVYREKDAAIRAFRQSIGK